MGADIDHGFDGQCHTGKEPRPVSGLPEIRDFRVLMKLCADTVSDELPDDTVSVTFRIFLYSVRYVRYSVPDSGVFDALIETLSRYVDQLLCLVRDLSNRECSRTVALEAIDKSADIDFDYVTFAYLSVRRDAVDDLLVDGYAGAGRKSAVAEE